jgi:hypothetical protein
MCINYEINSNFKNKFVKKVDEFNDHLIIFIENFDNKCTKLGNFFIRKYKYYFEPNRFNRARYNNDIPTSPLSPDEYEKIDIPIPIISKEVKTIQTSTKKQNIEKVDTKESFLDENVWDILNDI